MNGLRGNLQKNFPATQNSSFGNLLFRGCVVYYLCSFLLSCFFCYLSFLVIFSFSTNYFSTPRGYVKTKKVLHTLRTANSRDWILQSYRFRRSGRTVDTACAGLRAGPVNLRCRLLSSVLLFSS